MSRDDSGGLRRLRLYNFRNYSECSIELGPGLNLVVGRNAQGKTNLLEAVATLLLTRSPRASTLGDLIRWDQNEALVAARVDRSTGPLDLELRLQRDPGGRTIRTSTVNGAAKPARSLLGLCPVVLFWPEDLDIVKGGPDGRRRRLDMLHSQIDPRAAADLVRYRRVVEQRNALLRQLREGRGSLTSLSAFDRELVELGGRIQVGRAALVAALEAPAAGALTALSTGAEHLGLAYRPDGVSDSTALSATGSVSDATAALAARLARRRSEELARAVTLAGPHRDDIEIQLDSRPARASASQGQHRSIVLALTMAEVGHIRHALGIPPVLLLDDVLSELDVTRREALLAYMAEQQQLQVIVTSAEPHLLERAGHTPQRRLRVMGGTVTSEAVAGPGVG